MRRIWPVILILVVAGCAEQEVTQRTYRELTTRSAAPALPPPAGGAPGAPALSGAVPASGVTVAWQTPAGWQEQAGSGVRLVTFTVAGAECTITVFPGDVGGLKANLERWLGQLNVRADASQDLDTFIAAAEPVAGELPGRLYDFSSWVGNDPATPSMLAGIFEKSGATVFVKMMGPQSVLAEQQDAFAGLCRSVK